MKTVKTLGFVPYVALLARVSAKVQPYEPTAYKRELQRERFRTQIGLTDEEINQLSIQEALAYKDAIDTSMGSSTSEPKLISPKAANGVTEPIVVQLGSPVAMNATTFITELEFFAQTYAQLEDALVADTTNDRTVALLKIAKPLAKAKSSDPTIPDRIIELQTLPTTALDGISLADGMFILEHVTPRFFDTPDN